MTRKDIIRAWKDEAYRNSLSEAERAMLPENPAGIVEVSDAYLESAAGGLAVRGVVQGLPTLGMWCTFLIC